MLRLIVACLSFVSLSCRNAANDLNHSPKENLLSVSATVADNERDISDGPTYSDSIVFNHQIEKVFKRANKENYSTAYALLADLGLNSGSRRFYVVDLATKKVIKSGLVTHGSSTTYQPVGIRLYSNVNGSLCSSLGMYKIGSPYQGQFGLAYKLYGLDKDNSNAFARAIVLHSHSCVPDAETSEPICQSWGCPTVSPKFLQTLANYIDASDKPMLLYIFDSTK